MSSLTTLVAEINSLLSLAATGKILQLNSPTRERAFEAYVFALVLKAAKAAGGDVELVGVRSGPDPSVIVFRGAPGQMSSRAQDFVYARCTFQQSAVEVHVGVQYVGTSKATHELDVSIFEAAAADTVRRNGTVPGVRALHGAIECKFYDSSLGTVLGRAFVGLLQDCGNLRIRSFVTNGQHSGLAKYFSKETRPQPFLKLSPTQHTMPWSTGSSQT
jgi:hypothetical protein